MLEVGSKDIFVRKSLTGAKKITVSESIVDSGYGYLELVFSNPGQRKTCLASRI
jgi:hypothetical protein